MQISIKHSSNNAVFVSEGVDVLVNLVAVAQLGKEIPLLKAKKNKSQRNIYFLLYRILKINPNCTEQILFVYRLLLDTSAFFKLSKIRFQKLFIIARI